MKNTPTPNFDKINPRECVNSKVRRLHRKLNAAYEGKFRQFGLQGSMLSIMFIVGKNPGINQKALAERLVLDPSTMSRDIKKLTAKGWITAEKGDDTRNSLLAMTHDGYQLMETISPIWESLHTKVTNILGSFSIQQIDTITAAISQHFDEINN